MRTGGRPDASKVGPWEGLRTMAVSMTGYIEQKLWHSRTHTLVRT